MDAGLTPDDAGVNGDQVCLLLGHGPSAVRNRVLCPAITDLWMLDLAVPPRWPDWTPEPLLEL